MIFVMDVVVVLVDVFVMIVIVMMDIMKGLVVVGVVMMMLAQVRDVVVDMFMLFIRVGTVRGRGRVRNAFVDSLVMTMDVVVAEVLMVMVTMMMAVMMVVMMTVVVSMVVAVVVTVVVMMVVAAGVVKVVLFSDLVSISCDIFSAHRHEFSRFRRCIFGGLFWPDDEGGDGRNERENKSQTQHLRFD